MLRATRELSFAGREARLPRDENHPRVTVALSGELDLGLIRPLTGDDYFGVVMPMRI